MDDRSASGIERPTGLNSVVELRSSGPNIMDSVRTGTVDDYRRPPTFDTAQQFYHPYRPDAIAVRNGIDTNNPSVEDIASEERGSRTLHVASRPRLTTE